MMPTFSIIVPTYNQAKYIGAAIDSVIGQSYPDWEMVVVNDGSTDATVAIVEDYAARDSRIRVFHQTNSGVAAALNKGLSESRGVWINWLSSDDMFEANKLQVNFDWIQRYPECNFFFSYFSLLQESTGKMSKHDLWGPLPKPEHQILSLFYRNYISGITICVRRQSWEMVGKFDTDLHYGQDYDQWLRLLQNNRAIFIPEWLVINRNHAEQGSETFPEACYFDTARAAIRFINETQFTEIVPFANLSDSSIASDTVKIALEIACEPSSFLYALGPHPALVLRLLEWVTSDAIKNEDLREALKKQISQFLVKMALEEDNGDWGWMWRTLAASWESRGPGYKYAAVDPSILGRRELVSREIGRNGLSPAPLTDYLRRFLGQVGLEKVESPVFSIVIFCCDLELQLEELKPKIFSLSLRGHHVTIVGSSRLQYDWNNGAPVFGFTGLDRNILPLIGRVDLCFACDDQYESVWLEADQWCAIEKLESDDVGRQIDRVLENMGQSPATPVIDVVFLERVLSGGGAERVVMDIVGKLDRKKFKVSILTLFDGPACNELPLDVSVHCLQPTATKFISKSSIVGTVHWFHHTLKRIYHGITNKQIRDKLQVNDRLRFLYRRLKNCKSLFSNRLNISPTLWIAKARILLRPFFPKGKENNAKQINKDGTSSRCSVSSATISPDTFEVRQDAFLNTLTTHWPTAYALGDYLNHYLNNAVVVTVMEEAVTAAWLSKLYNPKRSYVAWLHILESAYLSEMYPNVARYEVERWAFCDAVRSASQVIFPSQGCRVDLITSFGCDSGRVGVIPNPINIARVRRLSRGSVSFHNGVFEPKPFQFVCVARLSPQKNHVLLIKACSLLRNLSVEFEVVLVGSGPLENEIIRNINNNGLTKHIFLLGELSNPYPVIASSDALVLTSDFEAFGVVLLEAMVCGVPIITTDCQAGPREILDEGRFGVLVPTCDPEALALAMQRIIEDAKLRETLIQGGYDRVKAFNVGHVVGQWENLIEAEYHGHAAVNINTKG